MVWIIVVAGVFVCCFKKGVFRSQQVSQYAYTLDSQNDVEHVFFGGVKCFFFRDPTRHTRSSIQFSSRMNYCTVVVTMVVTDHNASVRSWLCLFNVWFRLPLWYPRACVWGSIYVTHWQKRPKSTLLVTAVAPTIVSTTTLWCNSRSPGGLGSTLTLINRSGPGKLLNPHFLGLCLVFLLPMNIQYYLARLLLSVLVCDIDWKSPPIGCSSNA